jgi:hypothetical protein
VGDLCSLNLKTSRGPYSLAYVRVEVSDQSRHDWAAKDTSDVSFFSSIGT